MIKTNYFLLLVLSLKISVSFSGDTLYTHPLYPPIVFDGDEYNFYKYSPKYVPKNLLQSFKILCTHGPKVVDRFKNRSEEEAFERGLFEQGYRTRKEFCLEGFSPFTIYFHDMGIYYPLAMESFILLSFHQYLNHQEIAWKENKRLALQDESNANQHWKKRKRKVSKKLKRQKHHPTVREVKKMNKEQEYDFMKMEKELK